jgi:hypothetical protein
MFVEFVMWRSHMLKRLFLKHCRVRYIHFYPEKEGANLETRLPKVRHMLGPNSFTLAHPTLF